MQLSAYYETTRDVQTFDSRRAEGSVRLAQKLSSSSSILYRYAYRHVVASNLQIAVEEIPLFSQNTEVSEFDVSWLRDRRNSVSDPSRGDFENVDVSLAMKPIGSSANFIRVYLAEFDLPLRSAGGWSLRAPPDLAFRRPTAIRSRRIFRFPNGSSPAAARPCADLASTRRGRAIPSPASPSADKPSSIFNQDLRFPMHLPLIGDRLGGAVFYDAGNVFPSIRKISLRTAPPAPTFDPSQSECVFDELHERVEIFLAHGRDLSFATARRSDPWRSISDIN